MTDVSRASPTRPHRGAAVRRSRSSGDQKLAARRATVFVVAFAVPTYLALRGGGYDLGIRQEAGLVIWAGIAAGLAFGVLPRSRLTLLSGAPLIALAALAFLSFLSLGWTGSSEHTFAEVARIAIYAGLVTLALLGLNRYTWRAAALGLGASAAAICALAATSRLAPTSFHSPVTAIFATDRLSYPFNYWNAVAAWGAMAVAMGLAWSANVRQLALRAAALGTVPVAGTAVYLTYSRAGVIGTAVGIAAVLAISRNRWTAALHLVAAALGTGVVILVIRGQPEIAHAHGSEGAGAVALALVGAAAACAAIAAVSGAARVDDVRLPSRFARVLVPVSAAIAAVLIAAAGQGAISRAWHEFQHQHTVAEGRNPTSRLTTAGGTRHQIWTTAFDAFEAHPIGGIGPGTFEYYWAQHGAGDEFVRDAHSLYVEELAELGLPGLLLLLAFLSTSLGLAIRGRIRARRSAEVAAATAMSACGIVFLVHAGVDWMWEETAVGALGIGAMAIGAAAINERRRRVPLRRGVRVAAVAAAVIPALILIPGLVSTSREGQSEQALRSGDVADARGLADESVAAEPWAATPYEQRAAVEDRAGNSQAARLDLQEAIRNEPADWRQHLQLAQIELELGQDTSAREEFSGFQRLNQVSEPFTSFEEFRRAATPGCLVLGPLVCTRGSLIGASSCRAVPPPLAMLLGATGAVEPMRGSVVKALSRPIYYVSVPAHGGVALWVVDASALQSGTNHIIPLNGLARAAFPSAAKVDPAKFGVSALDVDARAAFACAGV